MKLSLYSDCKTPDSVIFTEKLVRKKIVSETLITPASSGRQTGLKMLLVVL
ncbi:GSCOCG00002097001-RA-CDS [Cotesia congregata]|nr:GSCOCG00002097001-RA-CDS [Cotesia congregata]